MTLVPPAGTKVWFEGGWWLATIERPSGYVEHIGRFCSEARAIRVCERWARAQENVAPVAKEAW